MEEAEIGPSQAQKLLEAASSYRPICLLDTMGKLLEKMTTTTTKVHGCREQSLGEPVQLSERQVHSGRHPGSGGHRL